MQEVTKEALTAMMAWGYAGAGVGVGLVVMGAGLGIGKLAAGTAEAIARQPSAEPQIVKATNLALFLLEGVAVLGVITCLLVVLTK
jgi:F-type H+-transporting ATPase subunit c